MIGYIGVTQAARIAGVCPQRIRALLAQHRIDGARRLGPIWVIPTGFTVAPAAKRRHKMAKIAMQSGTAGTSR